MSGVKLIITSDGSHSLLNETLNETYHSVHGAIQESQHVFINNGLNYFLDSWPSERVSIFEVGFGTALNVLLTVKAMQNKKVAINYTSIESFPIGEELWSALNYTDALGLAEIFTAAHQGTWEITNEISPQFRLKKQQTTLQKIELEPASFDVVYFDAFAPNKQPELWTLDMLTKVYGAMKSMGVFVTYCAKGQLKRDLKNLGFLVETLAGPPGKKEMVRAVKV